MPNWNKVGVDVVIGGVAGAADQLVQNWDEKNALAMRAKGELAANAKTPLFKQVGTYLNYGGPLLAVVAIGMGWVRGDMETRLATVAGQLAARKVTHQVTTGATSATPSAAYTAWQRASSGASAARSNQGEFAPTGQYAW